MNSLIDIADRFGLWVALCAVLLWYGHWLSRQVIQRGLTREDELVRRLDSLENEFRTELRTTLRQAALTLDKNSQAFHAAADALREVGIALQGCPCVSPDLLARVRHTTSPLASIHHE